MREFKDKVAVITGAASGLGLAMADRCVQEGMKRHRVSHRQHRVPGRTHFGPRVGSLQGDQTRCRHPLGNALP